MCSNPSDGLGATAALGKNPARVPTPPYQALSSKRSQQPMLFQPQFQLHRNRENRSCERVGKKGWSAPLTSRDGVAGMTSARHLPHLTKLSATRKPMLPLSPPSR